MLTFNGVWHLGEVFSSRMNPGFHCTMQMADGMYGIVWVSGLLMSTLWIEWPMVAVGLWYGQVHVMDNEHIGGILNAQRYRDEILRPIVVPFIHDHHLMLQGSVHNSWKLKTSQFLHGQHAHRTCWDALDRHIRQRVPVPANIQQICTAIEEEWTDSPQATINNLINFDQRQMVVTPDTDWFWIGLLSQYNQTSPEFIFNRTETTSFSDLKPIVLARIRARLLCSHMPKRTELRGETRQVPKQRVRCESTSSE